MRLLLIVIFFCVPPTAFLIYFASQYYQKGPESKEAELSYAEISWKDLRRLDIETNYAPPALKALNGKRVKIPGYVVPLEDEDTKLKEFLLVPSPQACIHVPPPPANQMILIKMEKDAAPKRAWGAVWMKGRFQIAKNLTQYGKISYTLYGEGSERYEQ